MNDQVRPQGEGPAQKGRRGRTVHDQGKACRMGGLRRRAYIHDMQGRIGNHLSEHTSGPFGDRGLNRIRVQAGDKARVDPELIQVIQKSDGPAVQTAGGDADSRRR